MVKYVYDVHFCIYNHALVVERSSATSNSNKLLIRNLYEYKYFRLQEVNYDIKKTFSTR